MTRSETSWPYSRKQGIKMALKEFVVHDTRSYFVMARNVEDAIDKVVSGEYHDKSDSDFEAEEWTP